MEERYLSESDFISFDWADRSLLPVITSGTRSGKTTFVVEGGLKALIEESTNSHIGFTLILVPSLNLKNDILNNESFTKELRYEDLLGPVEDEKVRVACFAQIAHYLSEGRNIDNIPSLIVVDEIQQIVEWSSFPGYSACFEWLLEHRTFICFLSATPSILFDYVNNNTKLNFVDVTPDFPIVQQAKRIEVIPNSTASTYLQTIETDANNKALVYLSSAKSCKELSEKYGDRAGYIVSKSNKHYNEQEFDSSEDSAFGSKRVSLREYVTDKGKLPEEIEILFFNDSLSTGCNVNDEKVRIVIAETTSVERALQARGRVRHDIDKLVIIANLREKIIFENFSGNELSQTTDNNRNIFSESVAEYNYYNFEHFGDKEFYEQLRNYTCENIVFIDALDLRKNIRNQSKFMKLDLELLFEMNGETSKIVPVSELRTIAKKTDLKDDKGKLIGVPAFIKLVNEYSNYTIGKRGVMRGYGRKTCYEICAKNGGIVI